MNPLRSRIEKARAQVGKADVRLGELVASLRTAQQRTGVSTYKRDLDRAKAAVDGQTQYLAGRRKKLERLLIEAGELPAKEEALAA